MKKIMYKILGLSLLMFFFTMCSNEATKDTDNNEISTDVVNNPLTVDDQNSDMSDLPVFDITEKEYDFGVIIQGEQVTHIYKFTNSGKTDLVISNVKASCGCTIPSYDKEPIKPGESGKIEIVFNSTGRSGKQHKTITVLANTQPNKIELGFTADVVVPENE